MAYSLSYCHTEELIRERGVMVDHATLNRRLIQYAPLLEKVFRQKYKRPVCKSWRMNET